MKRLAFFFAFVLFSFSVFAQGEEGGEFLGPDMDLIVQTQGADGYQIKFELVPISTEYCWSSYCWNFNTASAVSNNTVIINGTSNCYWNGWDYIEGVLMIQKQTPGLVMVLAFLPQSSL